MHFGTIDDDFEIVIDSPCKRHHRDRHHVKEVEILNG